MAVSLNSLLGFNSSQLGMNYRCVSRTCIGTPSLKAICFKSPLGTYGSRRLNQGRSNSPVLVAESDQIVTDGNGSSSSESSTSGSIGSVGPERQGLPNGSTVSPEIGQDGSSSPDPQVPEKRSRLTAREKLRAARVLSRNVVSKPSKSKVGSSVIDTLKESGGAKKRSGLPEAPTNLFDDSKRGMPKKGLTFDLPGGFDLFLIAFSFVFISTVMFATTFVVWKLGAIHFNEY